MLWAIRTTPENAKRISLFWEVAPPNLGNYVGNSIESQNEQIELIKKSEDAYFCVFKCQ